MRDVAGQRRWTEGGIRFWILALSVPVLLLIGLFAYKNGPGVSVALLFFLPIALNSWYGGRTAGLLTVSASGAISLWVDLAWVHLSRHPLVPYWNLAMELGVFLGCTLGVSSLKAMVERLTDERSRAKKLSLQIISAHEEERKRIARGLHDEANQALAALTLQIGRLKRSLENPSKKDPITSLDLDRLKLLVDGVLGELRELAFNLRSPLLDDLGLKEALLSLFRRKLNPARIQLAFHTEGDVVRLSQEREIMVFRVAQEALSNIIKHSCATHVSAKLSWGKSQFLFTVSDDGTGLVPDPPMNGHLGIVGMREQVSLVSGTFHLHSRPGKGVTIAVRIPLNGPSNAPPAANET